DLVLLDEVDPRRHADPVDDPRHERADLRPEIGLVHRLRVGCRVRRKASDDTGRREADAEQSPLSLGDDLEVNRGLVDAGMLLLELPQRRPLGFADGLACRLHLELHQRRAFFLRFTRCGWPLLCLGVSAGATAWASAGWAALG